MRGIIRDRRGSIGLLHVAIFFAGSLFVLYLFAMVAPAVIEPLHDFAVANEDVQEKGYGETLDRYQAMSLEYAPIALLLGIITLTFIYAAFRERFSGPRRPP